MREVPLHGASISGASSMKLHDFIGKEFKFKKNLAMKFTTQNDPYK
jgi:hypothetical protein